MLHEPAEYGLGPLLRELHVELGIASVVGVALDLDELQVRVSNKRIRDLEQTMMRNIRAAVRAAETGLERVRIAQLRSRLSREEYELEKAKFDAGLSTSRLVLDAQNRSDLAKVSEMDDHLRLKNALSDLRRVQGISLNTYGLSMLPPPEEFEAKSDVTEAASPSGS